MKIYSKLVYQWDGSNYVLDKSQVICYDVDTPIALCCGASQQQKDAQQQQAAFATQAMQQATQVFGNSSKVFNDLVNTFAPTVAAGPSQEGFSAAEKAALQSQAITNSGVAYRNARQAVGEAQSAVGGGNTGDTSSGANIGVNMGLANSAAANTADQLNQINLQNYQVGRENYKEATAGMQGTPNVFNPATSAGGLTVNAGQASANTANQIASQNNSWVQAVTGALGGIAGSVATGGMSNIGKGLSFFGGGAGGSSANAPEGNGSLA